MKLMYLTSCTSPCLILEKNRSTPLTIQKSEYKDRQDHCRLFKSLGMVPMAMPSSEIYTGLDRGVIDANMMLIF